MNIDIITILPQLIKSPFEDSILKRAIDKKAVKVRLINLRNYSTLKRKQVDDYQYGGGAGMVLMAEPLANCIDSLIKKRIYDEIIYLTPDGKTYNQQEANRLSTLENILIICGHYKGIDQRIRDKYITIEISVGDYVISGGELAAAIVADSIIRLIPGVLNNETSALTDSFQDNLLAPPVYTRPADFNGIKVPKILLSGDENKINNWREEKALEITKKKRPDLLDK